MTGISKSEVSRLCGEIDDKVKAFLVLGMGIGPSEAETFWTAFLRKLARRGPRGVKLVVSDAHEGVEATVTKVLNASWQRCRGSTSCATRWRIPAGAGAASSPPSSSLRLPRTMPRSRRPMVQGCRSAPPQTAKSCRT